MQSRRLRTTAAPWWRRPSAGTPRARRASAVAAVALVSAALVAGCGSGGSSSGGASGGGASGKVGNALTIDNSFVINSSDPQRAFTPTAFVVDHGVYQTLLTFAGADVTRPQPLLASSWRSDAKGTVYTFALNGAARFADGAPVTSADVVFSLRRLANIRGDGSYLMAGITPEAQGPHTVVLRSSTPNAAIPAIVANPATSIVNAKLAQQHGATDASDAAKSDRAEAWFNSSASAGAGSGPYELDQYDAASQITLKANPRAWNGAAPFKTVVLRNMTSAAQATNVQRGSSEVALDVTASDANRIKRSGGLNVSQQASPFTIFAYAAADPRFSPTLANPHVQEAIRYGLDYQGMIALAGPGGQQMTGVIPTWMPGSLPAADAVHRDLARARSALAAAGPGMSQLTLDYPSDLTLEGVSYAALAAKLQQDLQQVGFKVNLRGSPISILGASMAAGRVAFALSGRGADYMDGTAYLNMSPGGFQAARAHWTSAPAVVRLSNAALAQVDAAARVKLIQQWGRLLNQSGPYFPLVAPLSSVVSTKDLTGAVGSPQYIVDLPAIRLAH